MPYKGGTKFQQVTLSQSLAHFPVSNAKSINSNITADHGMAVHTSFIHFESDKPNRKK